MSANELVNNNKKPWLNLNVGELKIDGDFSYKEATKDVGDILEVVGQVAQWVPLSPPLIFGQDITVRPRDSTVKTLPTSQNFDLIYAKSPIYELEGDKVFVKENGLYFITYNLSLQYSFYSSSAFLSINNIIGDTVGGRTLPGCVALFPSNALFQITNLNFSTIIELNAEDYVGIVSFTQSPLAVSINNTYSTFVIIKIN